MRPLTTTLAVADLPAVTLRRPGETVDLYAIWLDAETGSVRTEVHGFWGLAEAERYIRDLGRFVDHVRHSGAPVRVLIDRRGVPVFAPDVAARFGRFNAEFYLPDDRIALVVDSSLVKIQLGRLLSHAGSRAFLSFVAAEAWLLG